MRSWVITGYLLLAPAWAEAQTAADFDKDGVPDTEDDCPTDPGSAADRGCRSTGGPAHPTVAPPSPKVAVKAPVREAPASAQLEGDRIVLSRPIEFESGSTKLKANAASLIEAMAKALARAPAGKLLAVRGHTDNRGAREANLLLSRRRAEVVVKALVGMGVSGGRLKSEGLGPDEPVAENTTDEGRAKNRRVELKLLDRPQGKERVEP